MMRKIIQIGVIILNIILLSGCTDSSTITNSRTEMLNKASDNEDAAEKLGRIIIMVQENSTRNCSKDNESDILKTRFY